MMLGREQQKRKRRENCKGEVSGLAAFQFALLLLSPAKTNSSAVKTEDWSLKLGWPIAMGE